MSCHLHSGFRFPIPGNSHHPHGRYSITQIACCYCDRLSQRWEIDNLIRVRSVAKWGFFSCLQEHWTINRIRNRITLLYTIDITRKYAIIACISRLKHSCHNFAAFTGIVRPVVQSLSRPNGDKLKIETRLLIQWTTKLNVFNRTTALYHYVFRMGMKFKLDSLEDQGAGCL